MQRRRALMEMQKKLDTSPIIAEYGVYYKSTKYSLTTDSNGCITILYEHPPTTSNAYRTMTAYGLIGSILVYRNGNYMDYWGWDTRNAPNTRSVINTSSDAILFSIYVDMLDVTYAYFDDTGDIIFAGKNTIYYGHRNISELN